MPRSVNSVASRARRKKMMKLAKGYFGRKKNVWTVAKNQVEKGWQYAYRDRRNKKREFRKLWIQRINAATRQHDMSYSKFIGALKSRGIDLNRKVLADLAMNHPDAFTAVIEMARDGKVSNELKSGAKKKAAPKKKEPKVEKVAEVVEEEVTPEVEEVVAEESTEEEEKEEQTA